MSPIRVGIIGTGFGGSVMAPGFRCVSNTEITAITSGRIERAKAVAAEFGVQHAFSDYREMLRSVPLDLVCISAPPNLHHEMTMAALDAGAHILCEKPFAMNVEQATEMLQRAQRSGLVHAIDFEFRFVPVRAAAKRLIDAGAVGEPFLIRIADLTLARTDQRYGWWFDRAQGGGLLQAIGSHYIDLMRWWIAPVVSVVADVRAVVPERPREDGSGYEKATADDTSTVACRLANGATGHMDISVCAPGGRRLIELYGDKGSLIIDSGKLYRAQGTEIEEVQPEPRDQGRLEDPRVGPFVELAQRVVDRINGVDGLPFTTFADGLEVQRVMDAIHLSSDEGREVKIG